jgi:hypothetical protein
MTCKTFKVYNFQLNFIEGCVARETVKPFDTK